MKRVSASVLTLSASCCALLAGCPAPSSRPKKEVQLPDYAYKETESQKAAQRLPWELWNPFYDLKGARLTNRSLILGDELAQKGKRRSALDAYLRAASDRLSDNESEAAALRIGSQYLALDQPAKALSTVSAFFKSRKLGEDQVSLPFALILGFAYGRHGQVEQALAWFSKSYRLSTGHGPGAEVARKGTTLYLRTLPGQTFESLAVNWRSDPFINELIGRERLRRSSRGYDADDYKADVPFWSTFDETPFREASIAQPRSSDPKVGVILSLSDRFASLGRDTKQGFELALEADREQPPLQMVVRDVGADTAGASAAVRELVANNGVSVIVGPLLSEAAVAAATTAREVNVPLVSLSKSESFRTGGNIFRLGATTTSQIDALIDAAAGEYGVTRFAVVYPRSATGTDYQQALRRKLGALGLELAVELSYAPGDDTSMAEAARELEASTAQAVLLPDSIDMSARFLSNLGGSTRKRVRALGTALWDNPVKIANSQALFEGAVFVTPFFPNSSRSVVRQFIESYRGKFQATPNFLAAQGFDIGTIVASALRQSLRDGRSFEESLAHLPPYDGVTGSISFDASGEIRRTFYVVEVTAESFQEKAVVAGASQTAVRDPVTYRGNQRVDSKTQEPVREHDDAAASGY